MSWIARRLFATALLLLLAAAPHAALADDDLEAVRQALMASMPAGTPIEVETAPYPVPLARRAHDDMALVAVAAGRFGLGLSAEELERHRDACKASGSKRCAKKHFADEQPEVEVELGAFYVDHNEIRVADYARCVEAGRCTAPKLDACSVYDGTSWNEGGALPDALLYDGGSRACVTRDEAAAYCAWVGGRLPSEAEWERAAAGAQEHIYSWGDVAGYPRLRAETIDMSGSLYEWTADSACDYADLQDGRCPAAGDLGIVRGGSDLSDKAALRTTARKPMKPDVRASNIGFRCVTEPATAEALHERDPRALETALALSAPAATGQLLELAGKSWIAVPLPGAELVLPVARLDPGTRGEPCVEPDPLGSWWILPTRPALALQLADGAWLWSRSADGECLARWPLELESYVVPTTPIESFPGMLAEGSPPFGLLPNGMVDLTDGGGERKEDYHSYEFSLAIWSPEHELELELGDTSGTHWHELRSMRPFVRLAAAPSGLDCAPTDEVLESRGREVNTRRQLVRAGAFLDVELKGGRSEELSLNVTEGCARRTRSIERTWRWTARLAHGRSIELAGGTQDVTRDDALALTVQPRAPRDGDSDGDGEQDW